MPAAANSPRRGISWAPTLLLVSLVLLGYIAWQTVQRDRLYIECREAMQRAQLAEEGFAAAQVQVAALQQRLTTEERRMPVVVTHRAAQFGPGLVLQLRNTSPRFLEVILNYANPTMQKTKRVRVDLPPNTLQELGWAEDVKLVSGDEIALEHADYTTLKVKMP